jgi:hypothetical protein
MFKNLHRKGCSGLTESRDKNSMVELCQGKCLRYRNDFLQNYFKTILLMED